MRSHSKASSAGSSTRQAKGLGRTVHGAFATRGASVGAKGSGAPSRARGGVAFLAIAAVALLVLAPSALAAPSRSYTTSFGSFEISNPQALAVDQSTGDVYAVEAGTSAVERFDSDGSPKNFTAGADAGTNILAGIAFSLVGQGEVAVDNSGGPADGTVYVTDVGSSSIKIYATDGSSLGALTGTGTPAGSFASACGVAVDQATGDLYVADASANRIWRYSPSGSPVAEGDYSGGIETSFAPCQMAADSGHVYAAPQGVAGGNLTRFRSKDFATGAPPAPAGTVIDATTRAVSINPLSGDVYADRGKEIAVYQSGVTPGDSPYYTFGSEADFGVSSAGVAVKAGGLAYVADRHGEGGKQIDVFGAQAPAPSRSYTTSFGSFEISNPQALAVDQSTGDVYAVEAGTSAVERFDSDGSPKNFTAGTDAGTNILAGIAFSLVGQGEVAVDNSGGPADGTVYVTDVGSSSIKIYATDGSSLGALTGTGTPAGSFASACGVAVDQATGDLYVADASANRIWRYSPSGSPVAESDYSGGIETSFAPCQLAADSGHVYAAPQGVAGGNLTRFRSKDFATGAPPAPSGVVIDPTTRAVSVNPLSGDVYADRGKEIAVYQSGVTPGDSPYYTFGSEADFGVSSAGVAVKAGGLAYVADRHGEGGKQIDVFGAEATGFLLTVAKTGQGIGNVTSSPPGIDCGLTCAANLTGTITLTATPAPGSGFKSWSGCDSVAANQCTVTMNAAKSVTASFSSPPQISATQATEVGVNSAKLQAQLNPGGEPTTYHFEYTDDADFQANGFANAIRKPVPDAAAGVGFAAVPVSVSIGGLAPATTYHFRLIATNPLGSTEGPELAFTTYLTPASVDPCANDTYRTGPGARLPDCRAYEQASSVDKNGSDAAGQLNNVAASISGDAVTYAVLGGQPGAVGSQSLQAFMARRGAENWSVHGLLPPPGLADRASIADYPLDLAHTFTQGRSTSAADGGSALIEEDSATGTFRFVHGYPADKSGSSNVIGVSQDGSRVFFVNGDFSNPGAQITPDAAPGVANVYVWDRDSGAVSLAGKVPAAPDAECGAGGPACVVPAAGSFFGTLLGGYAFQEHAVSSSGDQAVFNAGANRQLYARLDATGPNASTVQISASKRTDCAGDPTCGGDGIADPAPDPVGKAPALFQYATPSGSKVFFSSSEELTDDSNTGPSFTPSHITRADVADGGNADSGFIPLQKATGLEVNGNFLYWVDSEAGNIGRADIDEAECSPNPAPCHVNPDFITGADNPKRVAFYEGRIYWTNAAGKQKGEGSIGRADLPANADESALNVDQNYIDTTVELEWVHNEHPEPSPENQHGTGASWYPYGIAFDSSGHLYWGNVAGDYGTDGVLIRANPDGSNPAVWGKYLNSPENPYSARTDEFAPTDIEINGSDIYLVTHHADISGELNETTYIHKLSTTDEFADTQFIYLGSLNGGPIDDLAVDASHVYWTESGTGSIGRADRDGNNLNESFIPGVEHAEGVAVGGSHLYYSSLVGTASNPGNDLYAWDSSTHGLTDLAPDSSDEDGARVLGMVGASDDGSHVYFVANADLDGGGRAVAGNCARRQVGGPFQNPYAPLDFTGECNIYLWHAGDPIEFVARINTGVGSETTDAGNWALTGYTGAGVSQLPKAGRVSADGHTLLFRSTLQETSYDNHGTAELYRFNTEEGLTCVSCNPTGAAPGAAPTLFSIDPPGIGMGGERQHYPNNLSSDGDKVFFETTDKLVGGDTNGKQDVYEWEAPGSGSCHSADQDGGCLYLISTGTSGEASYFADASASGKDAFFFTRDSLVPQDTDALVDVYDARVEGGLAAQHAVALPSCTGEACRAAGSSAPGQAGSGSAAFSGPGNQVKTPPRNCDPAARRAQQLTRLAKRLHRRAQKAPTEAAAQRLRHQSAAFAARADHLSDNARRCRRANRRAAK